MFPLNKSNQDQRAILTRLRCGLDLKIFDSREGQEVYRFSTALTL